MAEKDDVFMNNRKGKFTTHPKRTVDLKSQCIIIRIF